MGVSQTYLDAHTTQVIEGVNETLQVTASSHLVRGKIMFEESAINIIVGRIAIDKAIKEKSVERKAPVLGRGCELMIFPFAGVVERIDGILVSV